MPDDIPAQDAPAQNAPSQEQEPKAPTAQDRINRLTRARHEAERQAEALAAQNQQMAGQLKQLQAQVDQLVQRPASPPPAATSPFGAQEPQQQPAAAGAFDPASLQALVQKAVAESLAPVTQRITQAERASKHQQAFTEMASEVPELAQADSELFKAFNEIWRTRPDIQSMDDGVALAVYAAQGIVGAQPQSPRTADKRAANVSTPRTAPQNLFPEGTGDAGKARELADKLRDQGSKTGLDAHGWEALLAAELGSLTPE